MGLGVLALGAPNLISAKNKGEKTSPHIFGSPNNKYTNPVLSTLELNKDLGLGGVPLAGCWKKTSEKEALETLEEAWNLGIRFFDTSPRYGNGISERRFGVFLDGKNRSEYLLSSKVGRLLKPGTPPESQVAHLWKNPMNAVFHYDYSASATRKSVEDSLLRLGVSSLDYVFIHDLTPGNLKENFEHHLNQARHGAIPELIRMKQQGMIKGWGFGINSPEAVLRTLEFAIPDLCLMATQYSLLDHKEALEITFPKLQEKKVKIILGSPLNCGYLAGNETWNYSPSPAPKAIAGKRDQLAALCHKFGVDMRTASLQFAMAHPAVVSILTGCRSAKQIRENVLSLQLENRIPKEFWTALIETGLIAPNAPIPH
ncbi:aldo/keto reductase [Bergeyella sp. RCAD1439]|uniref:aldo/keto reductase n=1 Tax=Bergeyella anatis TaxID=3113737 RepID=UPI002E17919A